MTPVLDASSPVDAHQGREEARSAQAEPRVRWRVLLTILVVLAVPLGVAAASLRQPTWYPVLDLAMTELRVRDIGTSETPLIGLPGRIGTLERQGSHPGPLSFYALGPTYRLLGSSAWSLQVGALVVHGAAMATALVLARRRGGLRVVLGVGVVLGALATAYGFQVLTEPWNPYLPLFWWVAFLVACWGLAERDYWVLPAAVAAGSLCAQTHLPYVGLTLGLGAGAIAVGWLGDRSRAGLRRLVRPAVAAVGVGVLLWSPVVADQVFVEPGNLGLIVEHFREPPEEPVGLRSGTRVMLVHLDVGQLSSLSDGGNGSLVDVSYDPRGSVGPGLALLGLWAVAVAVAWRLRHRRLMALHLVLGGGVVLGVVSASNIFGKIWYYLTLWAFGLTVMIVLAILATAVLLADRLLPSARALQLDRVVIAALSVALVGMSVSLSFHARRAEAPAPALSEGLGLVVAPTVDALRAGAGAATDADGTYIVSWTDALYIGSQAFGLVSELERAGLDVGVRTSAAAPVTTHRVIADSEADAVVHFATGPYIDEWRNKPDVVEAVHVDPRSRAERAEYDQLKDHLATELAATGLGDIVTLLDTNLFGASLDARLSSDQRDDMGRLLDLGLPISIFIAPPDTIAFP